MKRCPQCQRVYDDLTLNFCLDDGVWLVESLNEESATAVLPGQSLPSEEPTRLQSKVDNTPSAGPAWYAASRRNVVTVALASLAFFAIAAFAVYRYYGFGNEERIDSIAVMPFANSSADPDTEYISQGLAESLIYRLSQVPSLKVSPSSTVFRYKGKDLEPQRIGDELRVNAVLHGRITQRGDALVISAELIDVRNNTVLWGEQYDRKISDLLATQREMARAIVGSLRPKVAGGEPALAKNYTESNEAYQLYLRARFHWSKRTPEGSKKTIEYLTQAIEKDPNFALAYAALSDAYAVPNISLPPDEVMPRAKAAAMRALELDDSLAEAHTSMGRVLTIYDWDWASAEREFKRAIELNPEYPLAHEWYGVYLAAVGRLEDSLAERRRALELDPLSPIVNFEFGQSLYWLRDYPAAIEQFHKAMELDPNLPPIYVYLPAAYQMAGRYDDAISAYQRMPSASGSNEFSLAKGGLASAYAITGRKQEARVLLSDLLDTEQKQFVAGPSIAIAYIGLGDKDQAFAWLEKGFQQRAFTMQWLKVDPRWDPLRSDPRFGDLIRRMGLPR